MEVREKQTHDASSTRSCFMSAKALTPLRVDHDHPLDDTLHDDGELHPG